MSHLQSEIETDKVEQVSTITGEMIDTTAAPLAKLADDAPGNLDLHSSGTDELTESGEKDRLVPPQKFSLKWLTIGAAALVAVGGGWFLLNRPARDPVVETSTSPPIQVSTQVATAQAIAGTQNLTGSVEPVEVVNITSRVMGQIISLPVKEGDRVKAGQVLAKIDVKDISAQQNQATAAITQAQAGVTVAQAAQTQAIAGASQVAAQLNQAEAQLQQAQAQLQQAQAQRQQAQAQHRNAIAQKQSVQVELINAQLTQKRRAMLQREGAIGQSSLDEANTQVAVLQSRVQQATASIDQASQGVSQATAGIAQAQAGINQAKAGITRSRAALAQAQAQIKQAAAGVNQARTQVQQAQASKSQVTANLDYGIVTAPFNGVVTRRQTEVGAMAGTGQPLVTLESVDRLRLSVGVPESTISHVRIGQLVQVRFDAIDLKLTGRVSQVIPAADPISRNFVVKISIPAAPSLLPGMFGRAELTGSERTILQIPRTAIVERTGIKGVFQLQGDRAIFYPVTLGNSQGEQVEVYSGVKQGNRIILNPPTNLKESTTLVTSSS